MVPALLDFGSGCFPESEYKHATQENENRIGNCVVERDAFAESELLIFSKQWREMRQIVLNVENASNRLRNEHEDKYGNEVSEWRFVLQHLTLLTWGTRFCR